MTNLKTVIKQSFNPDYDGEDDPMFEFNREKFAKLIVDECITVVEQFHTTGDISLDAVNQIKKRLLSILTD